MRRRAGFLFIFGAAVPFVIFASAAWACGVLATLKVAPSTAAPGQTVAVSGSNYSANMTTFTPVSIRLDSRTGPVIGTITPTPTGKLSGDAPSTVTIPANAAAGDHVLLATQNSTSTGNPKAGTPGRTTMRVGGAAASNSTAPAASPWSTSNPGAPGGSAVSVSAGGAGDTPLPAIVLSLAMLSIGVTLVSRDRATRSRRRSLLGA